MLTSMDRKGRSSYSVGTGTGTGGGVSKRRQNKIRHKGRYWNGSLVPIDCLIPDVKKGEAQGQGQGTDPAPAESESESESEVSKMFDSIIADRDHDNKTKKNHEVEELFARVRGVSGTASESEQHELESEQEQEQESEPMIGILQTDKIMVRKTMAKYENKRNFQPCIYTKGEILKEAACYYDTIVDKILKGEMTSYYYMIMNEFVNRHGPGPGIGPGPGPGPGQIQPEQFKLLPFDKLSCGYIGKKRSMLIKQKIYLKYYDRLNNLQNKLIKYIGIDNFIIYILLPEICCHLIQSEFQLSSIDKAIDLMEFTYDYGVYIMDKVEIDEQDYDSDVDDDEEMKETKRNLNIVMGLGVGASPGLGLGAGAQQQQETTSPIQGQGQEDDKFVERLIGLSESEDDEGEDSV